MRDIGVTGGFEVIDGRLVNAFQQKDIDAVASEGETFSHFGDFQAVTANSRFTT